MQSAMKYLECAEELHRYPVFERASRSVRYCVGSVHIILVIHCKAYRMGQP